MSAKNREYFGLEFPEYKFVAYPKWVKNAFTGKNEIVNSEEEELAITAAPLTHMPEPQANVAPAPSQILPANLQGHTPEIKLSEVPETPLPPLSGPGKLSLKQ